jgi:ubiquinone/menaquinone biosynthesis C-methylase UbiE
LRTTRCKKVFFFFFYNSRFFFQHMRFTFALGVLLAGSALTEAAFTLKKKPAVRLKGRAHGAVPEDAAAKPAGAAAAAAAARTPAAPGSNIHLSAGASACSDHDVTCQSREHYEAYPYPRRDPAKEASDIMQTYGDELELLNYRIWGGHRDMNEPFRALVAGGGTGDATVWLARQLSPRNSENKVVHVDLSAASIDIARKRTEFAYVNDVVEFVQEDLLKLDPAKIGTFDYIQVSGVLHHLADPAAGLRVLKRLLKPGGGMGMMLYAKYGRTGVHDLQTMLKYIAPRNSKFDRIDMARTLFQNLPGTSRAKAIEYINKMITAETHSESGTYGM